MTERYVIGTSPVPNWCRDDLMPYIKTDGSTGYEFQTPWNTFNLKCGDVLINRNGRVEVKFLNDKNSNSIRLVEITGQTVV